MRPPTEKKEEPYDVSTMLNDLGYLDKNTGKFSRIDYGTQLIPTNSMLRALSTNNAESWNREKHVLLQTHQGKKLYLRGFNAETLNLTTFDMSNCDLIYFKWPIASQFSTPTSLQGASLIAPSPNAESDYYNLPLPLRKTFEAHNPSFNIESLVREQRKATTNTPPPTSLEEPITDQAGITSIKQTDDPKNTEPPLSSYSPDNPTPSFDLYPEMTLRDFINSALDSLKEQSPYRQRNHAWLAGKLGTTTIYHLSNNGIKLKTHRLDKLAEVLNLTPEYQAALLQANHTTLNKAAIASTLHPKPTVIEARHAESFEARVETALRSIQKDRSWLADQIQVSVAELNMYLENGIAQADVMNGLAEALGLPVEDETALRLSNAITLKPSGRKIT